MGFDDEFARPLFAQAQDLFTQGREALGSGMVEQAVQLLTQAIEKDPTNARYVRLSVFCLSYCKPVCLSIARYIYIYI